MASRWSTIAPVTRSLSRLRSIARQASRSVSTKTTRSAPRESASSPIAPEPANRSSTSAPSTGPTRLKAASRARSLVGRVSRPGGAKIRAPLCSPAMIRTRACWLREAVRARAGEEAVDLVVQGPFVVDELGRELACPLEQLAVGAELREPELGQPGLASSEQLAFAPQLEILLRQLEA